MKADHTIMQDIYIKNIWSLSDSEFKKFFENLYYTHIDSLYRFAFFRVSDSDKATDIVQDIFIKYYIYLEKLRAGEEKDINHKAILFQSLRNSIIDFYRQKKNLSLENLIDEGYDLLEEADSTFDTSLHFDFSILKSHIKKLKQEDQDIIYMRYFEHMSVQDIASVLGKRENSVSVKIHRILESLRDDIEEENF